MTRVGVNVGGETTNDVIAVIGVVPMLVIELRLSDVERHAQAQVAAHLRHVAVGADGRCVAARSVTTW